MNDDDDNNNSLNISQLNSIEKYLKKAINISYRKDIPEVFRKASLYNLYINIIKSFLLPYQSSLSIITNDTILECAYLLEFSKGITYTRELFEIYNNKLLQSSLKKEERIFKNTWPKNKLEQDQDDIKQLQDMSLNNNDINYILYSKYLQEETINLEKFQYDYINNIPDDWTVCSITYDKDRNCFFLCRYHKNKQPLILHIPIKRHISYRKGQTSGFYEFEKGISYLKTLLYKENNNAEMTQYSGYTEDEKVNNISSEEKALWWNERIDLDRHLEELLIKMEVQWIGGFKGVFCPVIKEYMKERFQFRKELENFIGRIVLKLDSESFLEFDQEICDCFLHLKENDTLDCELEDVIYYFLDYYQSCGIKIDYNNIDVDMYIRILRKILQKYNKLDLYDFDEHVIIIPDKETEVIPWENFPILYDKPTTRMLSLSMLIDRILLTKNENERRASSNTKDSKINFYSSDKYIIDACSTYYILNPGGDLKNTQDKFQYQFEQQSHWLGLSGKAPTEKEYMNGLSNYQLFMYFGHGGGECYIKGRTIRNHNKEKCAVTLLMGCSSGLLKSSGAYDPTGNSINYLLGQSPALSANLWDVTDRDIDRLTQGLLEEWGVISPLSNNTLSTVEDHVISSYYNNDNNNDYDNDDDSDNDKSRFNSKFKTKNFELSLSLSQALVLARRRCKLKFLIGASTVIYGIPIYNFNSNTH
ncbi:hypothetical protein BCR36DRAFT_398516 [Piromyces finnis]|uniref:separase n=1 Tax=Piromyces finnis TaxID=1754191 RepID=A0A1Y1V4V3_9FUNG|nr:hypothetical protein BCR36DRAFT_398516 [Piromyces finnis]|eukprot:ORX47305.1 hypothetical protein BCR36DRAFT_398516 [Piromyces finnis]